MIRLSRTAVASRASWLVSYTRPIVSVNVSVKSASVEARRAERSSKSQSLSFASRVATTRIPATHGLP